MVAGRLPFDGSNINEIVGSILSDKEPPPLARYAREVPAELERIVAKALRKNRDERYQTIKDLLLDLKSQKQRLDFDVELERSAPLPEFGVPPLGGHVSGMQPSPPEGGAQKTRPASSAEYLVSEIKRHKTGAAIVIGVSLMAIALVYWFLIRRPSAAAVVLPQENSPRCISLARKASTASIRSLNRLWLCCCSQPSLRRMPATSPPSERSATRRTGPGSITSSADGNCSGSFPKTSR